MRFNNIEEGIRSYEIGHTNDYVVCRKRGEWYYWIESTHPTANIGPFPSRRDAIRAYRKLGK